MKKETFKILCAWSVACVVIQLIDSYVTKIPMLHPESTAPDVRGAEQAGVWCIKPIFQWQTCWRWQTTYLLAVGVHKTFLPCIWQMSRFAEVRFLKRFQLVDNLLGPAKAKSCKIGVHETFDLP